MEILNNIWVALTTPNQELTFLLTLPLYFIESLVFMLIFLSFLNINSSKKQQTIYVFSLTCFSIFTKIVTSQYIVIKEC